MKTRWTAHLLKCHMGLSFALHFLMIRFIPHNPGKALEFQDLKAIKNSGVDQLMLCGNPV